MSSIFFVILTKSYSILFVCPISKSNEWMNFLFFTHRQDLRKVESESNVTF